MMLINTYDKNIVTRIDTHNIEYFEILNPFSDPIEKRDQISAPGLRLAIGKT